MNKHIYDVKLMILRTMNRQAKIPSLFSKVQNISNLIGREEYNFDRIVLLTSILHTLTKKATTFEFRGAKKNQFTNQK